SDYNIKSIIISKISYANPEKIFIFASPKKEDKIGLSARNQNSETNALEVLKEGIVGLNDALVGGHITAAGGKIQTKDFDKFKENIRNFLNNDNTF
ncbi:MAG: DHH family phosphoesterase, partial [Nanoarchaeota archaeon]|nr:DHH family phosphoesterase [Nanoarchaeota archaeon]